MVTNTLLLKLKDRSDENIAKAKDLLLSMEGRIEYLRKVKVEVDIRHGASSYELLLITEFAAMEDFDAYLVHPVHIEVAGYIGELVASGTAVCYEA